MKHNSSPFLLLILLLSTFSAPAQDCSQEDLLLKPGNWKAGLKGSTPGVSALNLQQERAVLSNIHQMIYDHCSPAGCRFLYTNAFGGADERTQGTWVADHFSYGIYVLPYLCDPTPNDPSHYYTAVATSTILNIDANVIWSLNNLYASALPDDELRGYLKLEKRPEWKNGYYSFGKKIVDRSDPSHLTVEESWLITYDRSLPFYYVSRMEYLQLTKKYLERSISEHAISAEDGRQYMNNIDTWLKHPLSELEQPAICMWNEEERFKGFVAEGTPGSFIAIKPDLAYYKKGLPRSVPQFFVVTFKETEGQAVMTRNMDALRKALDFKALQSMLGIPQKAESKTKPAMPAKSPVKKPNS